MMGLFRKKDPVCGMKEEKGKGFRRDGHWFCSEQCYEEWKKGSSRHGGHSNHRKGHGGHSCCH